MNLITILRTKKKITNCNTALLLHNITNRSTKSETKKRTTTTTTTPPPTMAFTGTGLGMLMQ